MTAKILCPWCGTEMRSVLELVRSRTGRNIAWNAHMRCPNWDCQAEGPFMQIPPFVMKENADEKLRAATLRRDTPPIKPMTLEEAIDASAVWIELLTNEPENDLKPSLFGWRNEGRWVVFLERPGEDDDDGGKIVGYNPLDYGSTWRCWSRKPTDEERSAAEWAE